MKRVSLLCIQFNSHVKLHVLILGFFKALHIFSKIWSQLWINYLLRFCYVFESTNEILSIIAIIIYLHLEDTNLRMQAQWNQFT